MDFLFKDDMDSASDEPLKDLSRRDHQDFDESLPVNISVIPQTRDFLENYSVLDKKASL